MYSPKINEDLIPRIYQVSKQAKMPMTRWVNQILERALADQEPSLKHPVAHHHDTDTRWRCHHNKSISGAIIGPCALEKNTADETWIQMR